MPEKCANIILIIPDQQRYDTIRALGFPYMFTGYYPHTSGIYRKEEIG